MARINQMIKEIGFKSDRKKNEYFFIPKISISIKQLINVDIDILDQPKFLHEQLSKSTITIKNKVPLADWMPIIICFSVAVCVSKKFRDIFDGRLKGHWYPTNNPNFFLFLLDNRIDALDQNRTEIINVKPRRHWYQSIEHEVFKDFVEQDEYLFTIPEDPIRKLSTHNFEDLVRQHSLVGVQFYKAINFSRKDSTTVDTLRLGEYDDEGNRLDKS